MHLLSRLLNKFLRFRRALLFLFTRKKRINLKDSYNYSIDLVYVTHSKDAQIFINSLNSALDKVKHKINNIIVVYPEKDKFLFNNLLISYNHIAFTDEEILNEYLTSTTIQKIKNQKKSPNWLKQQILKYLISYKVPSENYLVVDSDTIFVDDIIFLKNDLPIFYYSDELHFRYKKYIYKTLRKYNFSLKSYIAHMMLFNKACINDLLLNFRNNNETVNDAVSVLIDNHDFDNKSVMSEYELYSFYYRNVINQNHFTRYWRNTALMFIQEDNNKYNKKYYSISFHHYNLEPKLYHNG